MADAWTGEGPCGSVQALTDRGKCWGPREGFTFSLAKSPMQAWELEATGRASVMTLPTFPGLKRGRQGFLHLSFALSLLRVQCWHQHLLTVTEPHPLSAALY